VDLGTILAKPFAANLLTSEEAADLLHLPTVDPGGVPLRRNTLYHYWTRRSETDRKSEVQSRKSTAPGIVPLTFDRRPSMGGSWAVGTFNFGR